MNNKERQIIAAINNAAINENEINLFYSINENNLKICNETIQLKYLKCSLSNFKNILTQIKNREIVTRNLNLIEIYI